MATKAARPSAVISETAPSGMRPKSGKRVRRCPTTSPARQGSDACAQRNPHVPDRDGDEHADEPAEEDGKAENEEVGCGRRCDNDAYPFGSARDDGFRPDQPENVATLNRDPGCQRKLLAPAHNRSQIETAGPVLLGRVPDTPAVEITVRDQHVRD